VVALIAFIVGALLAAGSAEEDAANRFVNAWADQDFAAMHDELTDSAQQQYPLAAFTAAYREAQDAATATAIDPGDTSGPDNGVVGVKMGIRTHIFGEVEGDLKLPFEDKRIAWDPSLTFPSLAEGERVGRRLTLGDRAAILAKDGTPLAEGQGANRSSPLGSAAIDVAGQVGIPPSDLKAQVEESGYPADQDTGISGLELAFNSRLAGKPGGELLAVPEGTTLPDVPSGVQGRALATSEQRPGVDLKTTIDPDVQQNSVNALAGRSGGVVVLDARNGQVRAMAGSAYSAPQPPGSTFKVITTTAGLEAGEVKLDEQFPVVTETNPSPETGANVIKNAHDEPCGGDFTTAFAKSCNTVFAPLGVKVGEERLVDTAERYGFNQPVSLYDQAATEAAKPNGMTMPTSFDDPTLTALSASSIGQGKVLATPLGMASVAQTVAAGGTRSPTPIVADPNLRSAEKPVEVTSKENARVLTGLMRAVVTAGTGVAGGLSGVEVAGKTGTAELGPKPNQPAPQPLAPGEAPPEPEQIIDAWFIAFAPAQRPKLAIAVMLIDAPGDGGEVAAPIAAQILGGALG
jgi:cell division protein FtsI/penicillin-binding protein 2